MASIISEAPSAPDREAHFGPVGALPVDVATQGPERTGPSIALRLVALVLVALVPTGVVMAWVLSSWRSTSQTEASASVERLAEAAALQQEQLVTSAGELVLALALTPAVHDRGGCEPMMRDLSSRFPRYGVMGVADADGDFWCSSVPTDGPVTVADREYFTEVRSTGEPAVGLYQIGRVTGKPTVGVAAPLQSVEGEFAGAVIVSIDLSKPALLAESLDLPEDSTITVFDSAGTVLMHWPKADGILGRTFTEHFVALDEATTVRQTGLDGTERVYGVANIQGGVEPLTLSVGVPASFVNSAARSALGKAAGSFLLIGVGAGAFALLLGRSMVVAPVRRLSGAARRLASGDLAVRASFAGGGELSSLAGDFDAMAVALQEREHELRLAEHRTVEQRYRGLLDVAADAVIVADSAGRVVLFNKGAEVMFFRTADEVRGERVDQVVGADVFGVERTTFSWVEPDGSARWADAHASESSDGLTTVIIREVTDAKRAEIAEAALRERDERFRMAQAHSAIGMALVGLDGRWLEVNPALCRILGRSAAELHELTFQDITHPDDLDADLGEVHRLLAGEIDGYEMDKRYLRPGGEVVWAQLNGSVVRDDEGQPLYFVAQVQDVTGERVRQEELDRERLNLARSNADLEQFAYVASHDLSEPLRSISGFAALLEEDYSDELTGEAREYLGFMVDGTRRMQVLINDLLAFSRVSRSAMRFAPVDLGQTMAEAVESLATSISEAGAEMEVADLPLVQANSTLMSQLFQNLVANALKFHPDDVQPVVRVTCRESDAGFAEVVVEDNGIGIEEQYRERVFRMFQRLHARTDYEGTGMGLAVCSKIVDSVGGRIWITDSALGGAAFHLTLPLAQETTP